MVVEGGEGRLQGGEGRVVPLTLSNKLLHTGGLLRGVVNLNTGLSNHLNITIS